MPSKKLNRRIKETNALYNEATVDKVIDEVIDTRMDTDELFILDRTGSKSVRKRQIKQDNAIERDGVLALSKTEKHLVEKRLKAIHNDTSSKKKNSNTGNEMVDLWGDDDGLDGMTSRTKPKKNPHPSNHNKKKALKVSSQGFSYNPTMESHQDVIATAVALEVKKREQKVSDFDKITSIQDTIRKSVENGYNSDHDSGQEEEEEEDEDEENENQEEALKPLKQPERMTRAERNKKKERKLKELELKRAQNQKKKGKEMNGVPVLIKGLNKLENIQKQKRELKKLQEEAKKEEEENALTYAEAGNVPLTDELHGSLRKIIAKGSAIKDLSTNFGTAGKISMKKKVKRGAHRAKNIKWVAKHKYK
jgi:hypothetical protein